MTSKVWVEVHRVLGYAATNSAPLAMLGAAGTLLAAAFGALSSEATLILALTFGGGGLVELRFRSHEQREQAQQVSLLSVAMLPTMEEIKGMRKEFRALQQEVATNADAFLRYQKSFSDLQRGVDALLLHSPR